MMAFNISKTIMSSLLVLVLSCGSNSESVGNDTLTHTSDSHPNSETLQVPSQILPLPMDTSPLIYFHDSILDWNTQISPTKKYTRREPFIIVSQQRLDSTLTIVLEGIQEPGSYEGKVAIEGTNIKLYFWRTDSKGTYRKIQLQYVIKVPDNLNYQIQIIQ